MICQFTVKNFKSFQEEVTLDFQATNISEHESKIIVDPKDEEKILPLAAIYGPNGSGKSNLLGALFALISKVKRPICAACDKKDCSELLKSKYHIVPFKFNSETINEPTEFELFFRTKKTEYKYNLSVKDEIIIYESLFRRNLDSSKITEVFTRDQNIKPEIKINKTIFKNINISGITETLPLLSYLGITHKDMNIIDDVIGWFENGLDIVNYGNPNTEFNFRITESKNYKKLFLNMLHEMDIDIEDYRVVKEKEGYIEVYTKHIVDEYEEELVLAEESNGTIKLFGLLPHIADSIMSGFTLIVDELDSKLHPKLLEYIIDLYRDPIKNKKGAQLIFTSHDLMTMNSDLFRRDEIWFVAKNGKQASQLYSLVEFKKDNGKPPRKDEKYGKQYLEGRYGADPYLKRMIDWEAQYES